MCRVRPIARVGITKDRRNRWERTGRGWGRAGYCDLKRAFPRRRARRSKIWAGRWAKAMADSGATNASNFASRARIAFMRPEARCARMRWRWRTSAVTVVDTWFPRSQKRDLGHPQLVVGALSCGGSHPFREETRKGWGNDGLDGSHPSRKNKCAARVGHPRSIVEGAALTARRDARRPAAARQTLPARSFSISGLPSAACRQRAS